MVYQASTTRYQTMEYRRCGRSGLQLPAISLGLWHNLAMKREWKLAGRCSCTLLTSV